MLLFEVPLVPHMPDESDKEMTRTDFLATLNRWIHESTSTVFFGGAGVSTESGLLDFRSPAGIYSQEGGAEAYLTLEFLNARPEAFYDFYRNYFMVTGLEPNPAHLKLAEMEKLGLLSAVITQNIDGLHQQAGSRRVLELHGNGTRFYCQRCGRDYSMEEAMAAEGAFYCHDLDCGGLARPDIVMYGEALDADTVTASARAIAEAELLIVGGSSLTVYPAAGMIHYRKGDSRLALINLETTSYDEDADLVGSWPIGALFAELRLDPVE